MKPELPYEIRSQLPSVIVWLIRSFTPHIEKEKTLSPNLQRELERIQLSPLRGKSKMYMKGFDDFILD